MWETPEDISTGMWGFFFLPINLVFDFLFPLQPPSPASPPSNPLRRGMSPLSDNGLYIRHQFAPEQISGNKSEIDKKSYIKYIKRNNSSTWQIH